MTLQGARHSLPQLVAPRLFESAVLAHPAAPALRDAAHTTWLTYQHLDQAANKTARCLLRRLTSGPCDNPDGDRVVAVCLPPSSRLVTCLLAIHKAGGAYLPLDVAFPAGRVAHILRDARPALLLVEASCEAADVAQEEGVPVFNFQDLQEEVEAMSGDHLGEEEVGLCLTEDSIATILYTSGSTGVPKGVRVPHRAVLNRLAWQWRTFPYQPAEVCCFKTALTFVDSISEIFGPLLTGHSLVVVPKAMIQAVDDLVSVLDEAKVGRLVLVPSLLRSILLHCSSPAAPKLQALRLWVCSGEVLPADLLQTFFTTFTSGQSICNFFGSTEVMGDVTFLQFHGPNDASAKLINNKVPIGYPIDNCGIYLLDAEGRLVREGKRGEMYAAGLNTAKGYVGGAQPDKFIANQHTTDPEYGVLYRTGDYARVVDGLLVFEGRADSQIKVRGHRVDMTEVEMAVKKVEGVDKVTIICYKPGEVDQALLAFYTSNSNPALAPDDLKHALTNLLQPYMLPQVVCLQDFPLLVNGKVDRQELLRMYERRAAGLEDVQIDLTGVQSAEEEAMARVLLLTLGRVLGPAVAKGTTLTLDSNFFHVGGNSLNSVLAVTSLKDRGYTVGVGEFMKASSLREVLHSMRKTSQEEEEEDGGNGGSVCSRSITSKKPYKLERLAHSHKEQVLDLISVSFSAKGDLEEWIHTEPWEYIKLISFMYDKLVEQDLSFVYMREGTQEMVACALNFDVRKEPPIEEGVVSPKLTYVLDYLESQEASAREFLPEGTGQVIHSFVMGTLLSLGPAENVELIQMMEEENLEHAKRRGFKAVFTTNTSSLTQQVCDDLLSYKVLKTGQPNKWVASDGTMPFAAAPDSQRTVTTVKFI
ncbi:tyrocidine synthase 3-like isoform X2 [Portunus trituberculatus]|uniref:tyrocidine synthase 3-like isoform X2 n=1 Tax=Portunus trituberculatus TaxID=210409 RepID=UPI001E1CEE98|nr:tyrocidine synthase 3-like isoform X2 [Portunus trituberculatus]